MQRRYRRDSVLSALQHGDRAGRTIVTAGAFALSVRLGRPLIARFAQEFMGRGPKDIHAYLLGDFVVVRLHGLLTPAERQLAKIPSEKGRDLLKQVRTHLIEMAKPLMQAMVQEITGVKVVSLHHDISTVTCEAVTLFTLVEPPSYRPAKKT
jgi:uncharacterized protein YbcI